jgi:steroid delta-isomerase-like uncharacterized protein
VTVTTDTAKGLVRAFYESYNRKDIAATFDAYISPDLVNHVMGGAFDRAGWLAFDSSLFPAFDDFSLTVLDQVAEGNKVATRYELGGTQTGEFSGVPARGNTAFLKSTSVDRVENGLIVEHWGDVDFSSFLAELGAGVPTAAEAGHHLADEYFRLENAHDLDGLVALHAAGYVSHDRGGDTGIDEYRALIAGFFAAFPDSSFTPINVVADGDRLYVHFETTGTHTGDFMGIPATGRTVRFTEMRVRRLENGKFAEHWGLIDETVLLSQLR